METNSSATSGCVQLEEKYRQWKETYLPAGYTLSTYPLDIQLEALGNERLIAAHNAAMAGLAAEKMLAHLHPVANFHYAAGLTTGILYMRGLHHKRSWYAPE